MGDGGQRLHAWAFGDDQRDREVLTSGVGATGAVIAGRRTYDTSVAWWGADGPTGPARVPVFVVSHDVPEGTPAGGVYTFVAEGIERALEQARAVAGEKDVMVMGGAETGQQYLRAGLVDELSIHLVPVLFGSGTRMFENLGDQHIQLENMEVFPMSRPLDGRVALVAGATRGAGRGSAVALGEAGATVYCTGRTTRGRRSEYDRPETIEETAELVTAAGGFGIAVAVDHLEAGEVEALVQRIDAESGRLDVLVNNIWGGELLFEWDTPVWEHDLEKGLRMLRLAIDTHLITSHFALPLLIREPGGLVVEMTDGTREYNAEHYRVSAFYDLAKTAVIRLAFAQGEELAPHGCTAVALTPGWMRSEMMLDNYGVTEANWRDGAATNPHFAAISESPRFVGRAVAALAADPDIRRRSGGSFSSGGLAREYGFTDLDGSQPDCWRYLVEVQDAGRPADPTGYR